MIIEMFCAVALHCAAPALPSKGVSAAIPFVAVVEAKRQRRESRKDRRGGSVV